MLILNTSNVNKMVKVKDHGVPDSIHVMAKGRVTTKAGVTIDHNYSVENPDIKGFNDDGTPLTAGEE